MKPRRNKSRQTVVVDIGRGLIKMAASELAGDAVRFHGITNIALAEGVNFEDADLATVAEQMRVEVDRNGWAGYPAACLLSQRSTSTHTYLLPPMPDEEIRQAVELKLQATLHFDVDDAVYDFRCIEQTGDLDFPQMLVLVVVAHKDAVRRDLAVIRLAGLKPISISAASESLANLSFHTGLEHKHNPSVHVDFGAESTVINLFDGSHLRFSREIDITGDSFVKALMRPIITTKQVVNLTREQAEKVLLLSGCSDASTDMDLPFGIQNADLVPLTSPVAQKLATEIRRSIDYLKGLLDGPGEVQVVLSGDIGKLQNLDHLLEDNLQTSVTHVDLAARAIAHWRLAVCDDNPPSLTDFSSVLGYALGSHEPLNLLAYEEKAAVAKQRASRDQKIRATCTLALMATLVLTALPLNHKFVDANRLTQLTSQNLDRKIQTQSEEVAYWSTFQTKAQQVTVARGPVPDWTGVMKELANVLPESVQITSLTSSRATNAIALRLDAVIYPTVNASGDALTQMTQALNASLFFSNVRILHSSVPFQGSLGSFEATFEIISPPLNAEGSES